MGLDGLAARVDAMIAESRFSGALRVDRAGETVLERSAGWAHRAHQVPMTVDTRLAMASGSKVALGYLQVRGHQCHVPHLPVRGSGDGGAYTTVADIHRLWRALLDGTVVDQGTLAAACRPRSDVPAEGKRYGLGFWLHATSPGVMLEGYDAGVSFRTVHDPDSDTTHTVIANSSNGAWPVTRALDQVVLGW